ncbi:L-threonine dehydratase catabolic TdcB [Trichostrongylus colubriformis]|uniref:Serine racemase n=1 Tax=Trichostrongylus colubriformis TaxID=6319 RepID=A0AAN8G568_TRICO
MLSTRLRFLGLSRTLASSLRRFATSTSGTNTSGGSATSGTAEEEPMDPCCDPNNPRVLTYEQVSIAKHRLKIRGVVHTDCRHSRHLSNMTGCDVYLKMEVNQDTGSFKERGGRYALMCLTEEEKKNGVFAASAGNHAQAVAIAGKKLGIQVTVVMPRHAPLMKISKCKELGANVIVEGKDISVSKALALRLAKQSGGKYINGYDQIEVLAGAGTIAVEIFEQVDDVDAILVPIGGGGLLAGTCVAAKALSPTTKVIGMEPEVMPSFLKSLEAGKPVLCPSNPTLADGLAVPLVGCNAFETAKNIIHKVIPVRETDIAVGILRLLETEKALRVQVVTEGAGAISAAALLAGNLPELSGKKVVCILSGGNIDSTMVGRCIEKGLAVDNRLIRFEVLISDRPGGMAELAKLVGDSGASIKDMMMERAFHRSDAFTVACRVIAETRDEGHAYELHETLKKRYGADSTVCTFHGKIGG